MGAWIEIAEIALSTSNEEVAPLVGAWIEIDIIILVRKRYKSLPLWERGLKSMSQFAPLENPNVAPLVGAWIEIQGAENIKLKDVVAPLVGAWIEIIWIRGIMCI